MKNSLGYYRVLAPATPEEVLVSARSKKLVLFTLLALFGGAGCVAAWLVWRSALDGRVVSAADLRRATGLEVLAVRSSNLVRLSQKEAWAFRAWTSLRGRLGISQDGGVLGFLSWDPALASRWATEFADAARQRGQRVVMVDFDGIDGMRLSKALESPEFLLETLATEGRVQLAMEQSFAWTVENRARWNKAARVWQEQGRAVILLPIGAPGESESVLLSEHLAEVVVIAESGSQSIKQLQELVAPYREAGCNLGGALLDSAPVLQPAWLARKMKPFAAALLAACALVAPLQATDAPAQRPKAVKPAWLERFTLGPGDGFNLGIYGHPELTRNDVFVAADGRINFLQARGIIAAGLTIDELRQRLNTELARYYQHAQVVITPITFQSKRVFILGKVINKGAVILDRPLTIMEAVAEAGGLETGLYQQNTVELADLPRSLLVRKGRRLPVDFEKLFFEGDMSQNVALEPDDYLFFPSTASNDFQILGSVMNPGTQGLTSQASVVSAISVAGGFTGKAWKKKVMVVRGSLTHPEVFVVNVEDVLGGRARDFNLEPGDIVYVADRPWAKVEEFLESALSAFTQTAVASWTGANIGPILTSPILPQR